MERPAEFEGREFLTEEERAIRNPGSGISTEDLTTLMPTGAYNAALRSMEPAGTYWPGWAFLGGGGVAMAAMMWARQRLPWWPLHPIGFPIMSSWLVDWMWFSIFFAWLIKIIVLKYGGAELYAKSRNFFLGMIAGRMFISGGWLVVDYLTGTVTNSIFWI